jgi:hypothetical protein
MEIFIINKNEKVLIINKKMKKYFKNIYLNIILYKYILCLKKMMKLIMNILMIMIF